MHRAAIGAVREEDEVVVHVAVNARGDILLGSEPDQPIVASPQVEPPLDLGVERERRVGAVAAARRDEAIAADGEALGLAAVLDAGGLRPAHLAAERVAAGAGLHRGGRGDPVLGGREGRAQAQRSQQGSGLAIVIVSSGAG